MVRLKKNCRRGFSYLLCLVVLLTTINLPENVFAQPESDEQIILSASYIAPDDDNKEKTMYLTQIGNKVFIYGDIYSITSQIRKPYSEDNNILGYFSKVTYDYRNEGLLLTDINNCKISDFNVYVGQPDENGYCSRHITVVYDCGEYSKAITYKYNMKNEEYEDYIDISDMDGRYYVTKYSKIRYLLSDSKIVDYLDYLKENNVKIVDLGYITTSLNTEPTNYYIAVSNNNIKIDTDTDGTGFYFNKSDLSDLLSDVNKVSAAYISDDSFALYILTSNNELKYGKISFGSELDENNKRKYTLESEIIPGTYTNLNNKYALTKDGTVVELNGTSTTNVATKVDKLLDNAFIKNNELYSMDNKEVPFSLGTDIITHSIFYSEINATISLDFNGCATKCITPNGTEYTTNFKYPVYESGVYVFKFTSIIGNEFYLSIPITINGRVKDEKPSVSALNKKITLSGEKEILVSSDNKTWNKYEGTFEFENDFYTKYNSDTSRVLKVSMNGTSLTVSDISDTTIDSNILANNFYITKEGHLKKLFTSDNIYTLYNIDKSGRLLDKNGELISDVKSAYTRLKYSGASKFNYDRQTNDVGVYTYIDNNGNIFSSDYRVFEYSSPSKKEEYGILNSIKTFFENGYSYIIGENGSTIKVSDESHEDVSGLVTITGDLSSIVADGVDINGSSLIHTDSSVTTLNDNTDISFMLKDGEIYQYNSNNSEWEKVDISSLSGSYSTTGGIGFPTKESADIIKSSNNNYRVLDVQSSYSEVVKNNSYTYNSLYELLEDNKETTSIYYGLNGDGTYFLYDTVNNKSGYPIEYIKDNLKSYIDEHTTIVCSASNLSGTNSNPIGKGKYVSVKLEKLNLSNDNGVILVSDKNGTNIKEVSFSEYKANGIKFEATELTDGCYKEGIVFTVINYVTGNANKNHHPIRVAAYGLGCNEEDLDNGKITSMMIRPYFNNLTGSYNIAENSNHSKAIYYKYKEKDLYIGDVSPSEQIISDNIINSEYTSNQTSKIQEDGTLLVSTEDKEDIKINLETDCYLSIPYNIAKGISQITVIDITGNEVASYGMTKLNNGTSIDDDWKYVRTPKLSSGKYTIIYSGDEMYIKSPELQDFVTSGVDTESPYFVGYTKYTDHNTWYEDFSNYKTIDTNNKYVFMDNKGYLYTYTIIDDNAIWEKTDEQILESESKPYYNIDNTNWTNSDISVTIGSDNSSTNLVILKKDGEITKISDIKDYSDFNISDTNSFTEKLISNSEFAFVKKSYIDKPAEYKYYLNGRDVSSDYRAILKALFKTESAYCVRKEKEDYTTETTYFNDEWNEITEDEFDNITTKHYEIEVDADGNLSQIIMYDNYDDNWWYTHEYYSAYDLYSLYDGLFLTVEDYYYSYSYAYYNKGIQVELGDFANYSVNSVDIAENGVWTIESCDSNNLCDVSELVIDNIDKLKPTVSASNNNNNGVILNAEDVAPTEQSGCSGIDTIEYQLTSKDGGAYSIENEWIKYNGERLLCDDKTVSTEEVINLESPIIYVRAIDKAGNVSDVKMIDINGLLDVTNNTVYENGKTSISFYAEDISEDYILDDSVIDFEYNVNDGSNTSADNDVYTDNGTTVTTNQTTLKFTDESVGEFTVNAFASKRSPYGFTKSGEGSNDLVVVTVGKPTIAGGANLNITDASIVNDTVDKTYYRYYNKATTSNFDGVDFSVYSSPVELEPGAYVVEAYTVSKDKAITGDIMVNNNLVIDNKSVSVGYTTTYKNGTTEIKFAVESPESGIDYTYNFDSDNEFEVKDDNQTVIITKDTHIKCTVTTNDSRDGIAENDFIVAKVNNPIIGDVSINGTTVTVALGQCINDSISDMTVTVDNNVYNISSMDIDNIVLDLKPGVHTILATAESDTYNFSVSSTKKVYISDLDIQYSVHHYNGRTDVKIFDKSDIENTNTELIYQIILDENEDNSNSKSVTEDSELTIKVTDKYGNYSTDDIFVDVVSVDKPTISSMNSKGEITVSFGEITNGIVKAFMIKTDNGNYIPYYTSNPTITVPIESHIVSAYILVNPNNAFDESDIVSSETAQKEFVVEDMSIIYDTEYINGKTKVHFVDINDNNGSFTYSYKVNDELSDGNNIEVTEDCVATLYDTDYYERVVDTNIDIKVITVAAPTYTLESSKVSLIEGLIKNDDLKSMYYMIDDNEWIEYSDAFVVTSGSHTLKTYEVSNTHNIQSSINEYNLEIKKEDEQLPEPSTKVEKESVPEPSTTQPPIDKPTESQKVTETETSSDPNNSTNIQTGDNSNACYYVLLLLIASLVGGVVIWRRKEQ